MAEISVPETPKEGGILESCVGIGVVLLATFLGICSVKSGNISQKMEKAQVDRNNKWAWYQARNIRSNMYEMTADHLSLPLPQESAEAKAAREAKAELYRKKTKDQEEKMLGIKADAEQSEADYETLGMKDDQFDICEATLALGLAMLGVTALLKRWWLFVMAAIPAGFGVFMGVAGFLGMNTSSPAIKWIIDMLS
jgi:Domain of unknown function (DUF4337)